MPPIRIFSLSGQKRHSPFRPEQGQKIKRTDGFNLYDPYRMPFQLEEFGTDFPRIRFKGRPGRLISGKKSRKSFTQLAE